MQQTSNADDTQYAPEVLFSAIGRTQAAWFHSVATERPIILIAAYVALGVALTLLLTGLQYGSTDSFWLEIAPHVATVALIPGLALLPLRFAWLPVIVFVPAAATSIFLRVLQDKTYLPEGIGLVELAGIGGLTIVTSLAAAGVGKAFYARMIRAGQEYRADLVLIGGTLLAFAAFGSLCCVLVLRLYAPETVFTFRLLSGDVSIAHLAILRMGQLTAEIGFVLLLLIEPLARRHAVVFAASVVLGLVGAQLLSAGLFFHPRLDPLLPLMVLAVLLRPTDALVMSIVTLSTYSLATKSFSDAPVVPNHFAHILEIYAVLGLGMLQFLLLVRFWSAAALARSRQALSRLSRVQSFARVGYFVVDASRNRIHTDPVAAEILGIEGDFGIERLMRRIAPSDMPTMLDLMAVDEATSRQLSFRLSRDGETAYVSLFVWYEDVPGRGRVAYGAVLDLTAEHETERRLREALAELSEQQNRQTQLFSVVSHELRTPAAIVAMLLEEMDGTRDWSVVGPKLQQVVDQLLTVLADMRQVVRPDQNLPVTLEAVIPQHLLASLNDIFAPLARSSGIDLVVQSGTHGTAARLTDRTRLSQAMSNLIRNAILHSEARHIFVSFREEMDETGVTGIWQVADDGRGIAPDLRANLFSPFVRGQGGTAIKVDGSGLGLYIVKSAMELLGGTVTCTDRDGGGTVFTLRLPMPAAGRPTKAGDHSLEQVRQRLKGMSILLAEDSEIVADLVTRRIEKVFARVTLAQDGKSALAIQRSDPHDIVLTDLFMPELGGDDLTRALRSAGFTGPVIGMTAAALGEERTHFDTAGADTVLTKPFRTDDLVRALADLV